MSLRKIQFLAVFTVFAVVCSAQAPQLMNYQAVVRDANGNPKTSGTVGLKYSIHDNTPVGPVVYQETTTVTPNQFGIITVVIGGGGNLASVNWGNGPKYLQVELDINNTSSYTDMGTTQLVSVPYALYAANSAAGPKGATGDTGPQGPAGATGPQGTVGATGTQGPAGITGATGPQGPAGATGAQGLQGLAGLQGATGAQGPAGATGAQGLQGPTGQAGATGSQGPTGATGPQGIPGTGGYTHYVGEYFGGGVVYHVWKDTMGIEHGLIVATTDIATGFWSNVNTASVGISAQSSWDGLSNCNAVVSQPSHAASGAQLCLNLISGGQSDWYLPSVDELSYMWHNRFHINKTLSWVGGSTPLTLDGILWSSTEYDPTSAFAYYFQFGYPFADSKTSNRLVRPVRTF